MLANKVLVLLVILSVGTTRPANQADELLQAAMHGQYAEWTRWSDCSRSCGKGESVRQRPCLNCGALSVYQEQLVYCNTQPCVVGTAIVEEIDMNELFGMGASVKRAQAQAQQLPYPPATVVTAGYLVTTAIPSYVTTVRPYQPSATPPPVVGPYPATNVPTVAPAQCTLWSAWQACSVTCGQGVQQRCRRCGYTVQSERQSCTCTPCQAPVAVAQWSQWNTWSQCSVTCNQGAKTRTRTCTVPNMCPGNAQEQQYCMAPTCAAWLEWQQWSQCSTPYGQGQQTRTRGCSVAGQCFGQSQDQRVCGQRNRATVSPQWSAWEK